MTDITLETARKRGFLGKLWALTWPYFHSEDWKVAWLLLLAVIGMTLGGVYISVQINVWYGIFYNALQAKDLTQTPVTLLGHEFFSLNRFFYLIGEFTILALIGIVFGVYAIYLRQMLQIRWRRWMTERMLDRWFGNQAYYRLELLGRRTDNPEQRIEEDIDNFTTATLRLSLGLLDSVVTLVSFLGVLWVLSGPVALSVFGTSFSIPGYMVWVATAYALVGSVLTFWIGKRLVRISFEQQQFRANFRFRMTRLRENAESIALYKGEADEHRGLMAAFAKVWKNWWDLMRFQKRLNWFTNFYGQLAIIFPILVAAPRYFSGAIDFGAIFQISSAFAQVQGALSWFVDAFPQLADWKASTDRLTGFVDVLEQVQAEAKRGEGIAHGTQFDDKLSIGSISLALPDGRVLIENFSTEIAAGDKVLISGTSGSGKTTLFRALAGLWPFGSGSVQSPAGARALFLPQRPYLPIGTLRAALAYPAKAEDQSTEALQAVLRDVKLEHLTTRLDEEGNWAMALSVGEQQRLAIARALLLKPDWLFLDEATAALDEANEQLMYGLIAERLPNVTMLSIAHRPAVARYHRTRLTIMPETRTAEMSTLTAS